jgi:hypothetical protein
LREKLWAVPRKRIEKGRSLFVQGVREMTAVSYGLRSRIVLDKSVPALQDTGHLGSSRISARAWQHRSKGLQISGAVRMVRR